MHTTKNTSLKYEKRNIPKAKSKSSRSKLGLPGKMIFSERAIPYACTHILGYRPDSWANVRQDPKPGTSVAENNNRNAAVASSADISSRVIIDLFQSSQETITDSLDECYSPLDLLQQRLGSDLSVQTMENRSKPMCSTCHVHRAAFSLFPCCHNICNLCYQIRFRSQSVADILHGEVCRICDTCSKVCLCSISYNCRDSENNSLWMMETVDKIVSVNDIEMKRQQTESPTPSALFRSLAETTSYRRLSCCEQVSQHLLTSIKWAVIRISNASSHVACSQTYYVLHCSQNKQFSLYRFHGMFPYLRLFSSSKPLNFHLLICIPMLSM